jgi:hypothetical protein
MITVLLDSVLWFRVKYSKTSMHSEPRFIPLRRHAHISFQSGETPSAQLLHNTHFIKMPSQFFQNLSQYLNPKPCGCCDHYFSAEDLALLEPEKASFQVRFAELRQKLRKKMSRTAPDDDTRASAKRRLRKYICLGRKQGLDVQRSLRIPGAAASIAALNTDEGRRR